MFGVALLTSALLASAAARIYDRCELARDLQALGVDKDHLATWVCIAFHESRFDTAARNPHSGDHGLLQISELYWCGPGKACGAPCSAFRDDDISDDVECALQIYKEHTRLQGDGFLAWVVYPHHCRNNAKKYLADCDSQLKDVSYKLDVDRGRALKTRHRSRGNNNDTVPYYKKFPNIDDLKPPYIPINTLLRGKFEESEGEREKETVKNYDNNNYYNVYNENKKHPFEWLNNKLFITSSMKIPLTKIYNIDELKPPVYDGKTRFEYSEAPVVRTTTTLRTPTTTIDPALRNIKPPNPKRIESNQFRRRKMMTFDNNNENKNLQVTSIPSFHVHNFRFPVISSTSIPTTTTTKRPTYIAQSYTQSPINQIQTSPKWNKKEESPREVSRKNNRQETVFVPLSRAEIPSNNSTSYAKRQELSASTTPTSPTYSPLHKDFEKDRNLTVSNSGAYQTTTATPIRFHYIGQKSNSNLWHVPSPTPSTLQSRFKTSNNLDLSFTTTKGIETPTTPTLSTFTTPHTWINHQFKNQQDYELSTVTPRPTRPWVTFTSRTKCASSSTVQMESTTARSAASSSTTIKHSNILPSQQPRTTATERTTTTTQSIFDLYLKPTKRPNIVFNFPEFKDRPFKLRIFSEGTTSSPSHFYSGQVRSYSTDNKKPDQKIS
ncbi:uncharacterized protein LOC123705236 [Colias croceus]|uniref:uncharacterized protein LOC123705236 n=1 Tax=Colias crocea TaxID=72248 RepID=UPI001E27C3F9|nr:uncharacterized protein LOC123705236 [Colias croceus]